MKVLRQNLLKRANLCDLLMHPYRNPGLQLESKS